MVIFLYGPNDFLARRRLAELKQAFRAKYDPQGLNITSLEGDKLTVGRLAECLGTRSMFNPRVFLVIENLFAHKNEELLANVEQYLGGQVSSDNVVVIIDNLEIKKSTSRQSKPKAAKPNKSVKKTVGSQKQLQDFLMAQPHSQAFKELTPVEATDWLRQEVKGYDLTIAPDAAQLLLGLTGSNLWQLEQEVHKLASLAQANKQAKIEAPAVRALVAGVFEDKIFALTDAIGQRERSRAARLLEEELLAGQAPEQIFAMVLRQFRVLLAIRQAVESGWTAKQMAEELKLHPFVVQKAAVQARNFSLPALKNIFGRLVQIEHQWKSGQADVATSLDLLIAKL